MLEIHESWLKAAKLYEAASSFSKVTAKADWDIIGNGSIAKELATHELFQFLHSKQGETALRLLKASGQAIQCGNDCKPTSITRYVLNFQGLIRIEGRGRCENIDPREFVEVVCDQRIGGKIAADLMDWLFKELNTIARQAPQPELVSV